MKKKTKAQSILEYAAFLGIITLAFIAMRVYLQRGLQGKLKDMAKEISDTQYVPENVNSSYTIEQQQRLSVQQEGYQTTQDIDMISTRRGSETSTLEIK